MTFNLEFYTQGWGWNKDIFKLAVNSKFTSCVSQSGKQWAHSDWGEFTIYWGSQLETVRFPTAAQSGELSQSRAPQPGESCSHRMLSHPRSAGIYLTWSLCMILFMSCWIWLANLLRIFASIFVKDESNNNVFIKDIGLQFSLQCLILLSGWRCVVSDSLWPHGL